MSKGRLQSGTDHIYICTCAKHTPLSIISRQNISESVVNFEFMYHAKIKHRIMEKEKNLVL